MSDVNRFQCTETQCTGDHLKSRWLMNEYGREDHISDYVCIRCGAVWGLRCGRQLFRTKITLTEIELTRFKKESGFIE